MRGMNGMLRLKEKNNGNVVYYYSSDSSLFGSSLDDIVVDGEIACTIATKDFYLLKTATHDDDGSQAKWLIPYIWQTISEEDCPAEKFIATG